MAGAEAMIGWPEPALLAKSPIKLLLLPSVGYEEYVTEEIQARNLTICNVGSVYSQGVAEHCVAMMMALARRLPEYTYAKSHRHWRHLHRHQRLSGSTVCVVGMGSLGSAIARRCAALGMQVTGVRQHPRRPSPPASEVFGSDDLATAVTGADFVVGALPGGTSTERLISAEVFAAMKIGAFFCNVGRGSSVDEHALVDRLLDGSLAGAGLDVFAEEPLPHNSPLWDLPTVIVTPHVAGYTWDYADELCEEFSANLTRFDRGEPLNNTVNLSLNTP